MASQNIIHRIYLGFSNAWLYGTPRNWLLIDGGMKINVPRLYRRFRELGVEPQDVKLIVATHAHFDHVGAFGRLQKDAAVPVAAHVLGVPILAKAKYVLSDGFTMKAKIGIHFMRYMVNKSLVAYDPVDVELAVSGEWRLDDYGFDATLISTPGHSDDSLSVLADDGNVFSGDLIVNRPYKGIWQRMSIFGTSQELIKAQWRMLIERGAKTVRPGHGEIFPITDLLQFL